MTAEALTGTILPEPAEISFDALPVAAARVLEDGGLRNGTDFKIDEDKALVYDFGTDRTYAFHFRFLDGLSSDPEDESIALVDVDNSGTKEGWGHLDIKENDGIQPYVGWTATEKRKQGKGLAKRRLRIMNQLSLLRYGRPLNSGAMIEEEAVVVWVRLVDSGEAEETAESDIGRFRFIEVL